MHKKYFILLFILSVISSFLAPMRSFILQWLIDSHSVKEAITFLALGSVIILSNFIVSLFSNNLFAFLRSKCLTDIQDRIIRSSFVNKGTKFTISEKISSLSNDINIISSDYFDAIFSIFTYGLLLLFALILYVYIDVSMLIFVALAGGASVVVPRVIDCKIKKERSVFSTKNGEYISQIKEFLIGMPIISNYSVESLYLDRCLTKTEELNSTRKKYDYAVNLASGISSLVSNLLFFVVLLLGMVLVINGKISLGYMVAATNLSNFVIAPCQVISTNLGKYKGCKEIIMKLNSMMMESEKEFSHGEVVDNDDTISKISLADLSFSYSNDAPNLLHNISVEFLQNKKIAIVGESGCGKSSLARILHKDIEDYSGKISINGMDYKFFSHRYIRKHIGMVTQNEYVFNDSIRNNITLYENYEEYEVEKAIEKAGLKDYVESLPEKLDYIISENGMNMSGGQLQRIAIARTFLRGYECIIGDEITSNLDEETAKEVMDYFLTGNGMRIVITHDVSESMLNKFDLVYELKRGHLERYV